MHVYTIRWPYIAKKIQEETTARVYLRLYIQIRLGKLASG